MGFFSRFKKILVVEDDPSLRKALVLRLSKEGYKVIETGEGDKVTGLVQIEKPHLVVLDLMLPGRDGITVLEQMRDPEWNNKTPVIILTNLSGEGGLRQQADNLNAIYFDKATTDIQKIVDEVKRIL